MLDQKKLLYTSGIISGPTGSGKTLLAELRMLVRYFNERNCIESATGQHHKRDKTIFLVPMKAIGLEKLRYFIHLYGRFGIEVLYSDGDMLIPLKTAACPLPKEPRVRSKPAT